eukprot:788218-Pyramimonas_sp.AAC.1
MPLMGATVTLEASSVARSVKRIGFKLSHARYPATTASQGQTTRAAVTIDYARQVAQGRRGINDDT